MTVERTAGVTRKEGERTDLLNDCSVWSESPLEGSVELLDVLHLSISIERESERDNVQESVMLLECNATDTPDSE